MKNVKKWLKKILLPVYALLMRCFDMVQYKWILPATYNRHAKKPVDKRKVVFVETRQNQITDSFSLLHQALQNDADTDVYTFFLQDMTIGKLRQFARAVSLMKCIGDASVIFANDSSCVFGAFQMRSETRFIQVWHGCGAFKKWGFSNAEKKFGATKKALDRFPMHRNYSLVTTSSDEVNWAYADAFGFAPDNAIVQGVGVSRTDVFFDENALQSARLQVHSVVPASRNKKIILYAPTFRGHVKSAVSPDRLDIQKLKEKLGNEYVLLFKHHPFVKHPPEIPETCADFAFDVTKELSIEQLIMTADICISDYSSLVFEYSLFTKPMLFFSFDIDTYRDWRGFYYDYRSFVPGPIVMDTDAIIDYIEHLEERFDPQTVIDFRNKFMRGCDGHATERILAYAKTGVLPQKVYA